MNFYVAMVGEYREGSYDRPDRPLIRRSSLFVGVRISAGTERLCLSLSDSRFEPGRPVPSILPIRMTLAGILVSRSDDKRGEVFIMERHLPADVGIEGRFIPSDGYAHVRYERGGIAVEGAGRRVDPAPATGPGDRSSWQISARRIAWQSEIIET